MEGYTGVDYADSLSHKRFTLGYCIFLCGNLVAEISKKQNAVVRWSFEVEFRVTTQVICKLLWMKKC